MPASVGTAETYVPDQHITGTLYPTSGDASLIEPSVLKTTPDDTAEERVYGQTLVLTKHKADKQ